MKQTEGNVSSAASRRERPRARSVLVVALVGVLVAAACGGPSRASGSASGSTATTIGTGPGATLALRPLHAIRGTNARIVDDQGRQVLLRGVNLNSLGDYFQANDAYPSTLPVTDRDWDAMARDGFDVVRLLISWSKLEPTRGHIDARYLAQIHSAVAHAAAHGLYSVIDMHQDASGKYVASPAGVTCPAGAQPGIGWDGAPEWATLTDGADTCAAGGVRELAPAVMHAFDHFYADTDGIQTELVKAWGAVARSFATDPAVAGYDLFNEPNWGTDVGTSGERLGAFYRQLVPALRRAEKAGGGFSHIVFFEPVVLFPAAGTLPPAADVTDPNMVFAPHNYHGSTDPGTVDQGFADEAAAARQYGTTFWIGEYGWFGEAQADLPGVTQFAAAEDRYLVGGAWWQWRQACGDPHSVGRRGGKPSSVIVELNDNGCPGDADLGPVPAWYPSQIRPYPRSAPGRLTSLSSDPATDSLSLTGDASSAAKGAEVVVWVPNRNQGRPRVGGQGLSRVDVTAVPSGWIVTARTCPGGYSLALGAAAPELSSSCATSGLTD
jgi:endoglycosylceramidase